MRPVRSPHTRSLASNEPLDLVVRPTDPAERWAVIQSAARLRMSHHVTGLITATFVCNRTGRKDVAVDSSNWVRTLARSAWRTSCAAERMFCMPRKPWASDRQDRASRGMQTASGSALA